MGDDTTIPTSPFEAQDAFVELDVFMEDTLRKHRVRAGQLAVCYQGELKYAGAWTFANLAKYPKTKITSRMRMGSISKVVTWLATWQLIDEGLIGLHQSIEDAMGIAFQDDKMKDVTIEHLLCHIGWFHEPPGTIATPQNVAKEYGSSYPVAIEEFVTFVQKYIGSNAQPYCPPGSDPATCVPQPLFIDEPDLKVPPDPVPFGTNKPYPVYSGLTTILLGWLIQQLRGEPYEDAVKEHLFKPLGVERARITRATVAGADSDDEETRYHAGVPGYGFSIQGDGLRAPIQYDPVVSPVFLTNGDWAMAAVDWARVLSAFDLDPNPIFKDPTTPSQILVMPAQGMFRGIGAVEKAGWFWGGGEVMVPYMMDFSGQFAGCTAYGFRRFDGVVAVVAFNTDVQLDDLRGALEKKLKYAVWPAIDLFQDLQLVPT